MWGSRAAEDLLACQERLVSVDLDFYYIYYIKVPQKPTKKKQHKAQNSKSYIDTL
jgi:hypothetical protein